MASILDLDSRGEVRILHFQSRDIIKWKIAGPITRRLPVQIRFPLLKNIRKVTRTMLSTVIRIQFKMIQNRIQFWCNMKNWITFGVLIRTCGLCIV